MELLRDIRSAFHDADVIRSSDLVAKLTADPERPWAEWKHGRPLTQKQLAGLLAPFHIISLTVHPPGCRTGRATAGPISRRRGPPTAPVKAPLRSNFFTFEASKRPNAAETGTTSQERLDRFPKKSVVLAGAEFGCFCTENLLVAHRPVMRKVADNGQLFAARLKQRSLRCQLLLCALRSVAVWPHLVAC